MDADIQWTFTCYLICVQDPTNLQGKLQKHENFAAELSANQARIETVTKTGEDLIAQDHYNKEHIRYIHMEFY